MIIHVVPEKWYKEFIPAGKLLPVYLTPDSPFWHVSNFINIRNSRSIDPDRGVPLNGENILKLQFDDVRELPGIRRRPFTADMAEKIIDFVARCDRSRELYVNCSAGISRSGAVGYILNWYANRILEDHPQDFELFPRLNPQIDANPLVKKILTEVIMKQNPTFPEVIP